MDNESIHDQTEDPTIDAPADDVLPPQQPDVDTVMSRLLEISSQKISDAGKAIDIDIASGAKQVMIETIVFKATEAGKMDALSLHLNVDID